MKELPADSFDEVKDLIHLVSTFTTELDREGLQMVETIVDSCPVVQLRLTS